MPDQFTDVAPVTAMRVPDDCASTLAPLAPAMRPMRAASSRVSAGAYGSSAAASSATDANRALRSFCRHRATTAASALGTSGRIWSTVCGVSVSTMAVSCVTDSAKNGTRPVSSSNRITPSAQMSLRSSAALDDLSCSGDM